MKKILFIFCVMCFLSTSLVIHAKDVKNMKNTKEESVSNKKEMSVEDLLKIANFKFKSGTECQQEPVFFARGKVWRVVVLFIDGSVYASSVAVPIEERMFTSAEMSKDVVVADPDCSNSHISFVLLDNIVKQRSYDTNIKIQENIKVLDDLMSKKVKK